MPLHETARIAEIGARPDLAAVLTKWQLHEAGWLRWSFCFVWDVYGSTRSCAVP